MNSTNPLFRNLFKSTEQAELSDEELDAQDAEAKKARIKHHRDNVRNGPVGKMRSFGSGAQRRQKARDKAAFERKINRKNRRDFMAKQAETAVLRGHLVILGQVECQNESTTFTDKQKRDSAVWVVRKYGTRDELGALIEDGDLLLASLKAAIDDFLARHGVTA